MDVCSLKKIDKLSYSVLRSVRRNAFTVGSIALGAPQF